MNLAHFLTQKIAAVCDFLRIFLFSKNLCAFCVTNFARYFLTHKKTAQKYTQKLAQNFHNIRPLIGYITLNSINIIHINL